MTWSADEEYRTRVLSRRGAAALRLRHPAFAYGPAALVLMYTAGLMTTVWAAAGFADMAQIAGALTLPAGAATAVAAMAVGSRLRQREARSAQGLIFRVAAVWALFGAVWALGQAGPSILASAGEGFARIGAELFDAGLAALAGALVGGVGGLAGGAAATLLCVERQA